ncbi:MAG: TetR/AcrR family transcriptional regulator [Deltaproteobacteria bacterium]|nr:TetR/AcrR family transcriptional regulator [Deltaproteobacteria bacterium]MBW2360777.1 TetR/AcrR family transcriptional regulator [Deltaproteobacteria bacterium]
MPRAGDATRRSILDAAEKLFAERGPGAVSLNEVNSAARQRNTAAVHYHFKNRDGLLAAVLERHREEIDARRGALLDGLELSGDAELDALARVLVLPLAEKLENRSGRCYLRIQSTLLPQAGRPHPATSRLVAGFGKKLEAVLPPDIAEARGRLLPLLVFPALAERAQLEERQRSARAQRTLFVENLIDAIVAILSAPVSERTAQCTVTSTSPPGKRLRRRPPRRRPR